MGYSGIIIPSLPNLTVTEIKIHSSCIKYFMYKRVLILKNFSEFQFFAEIKLQQ